MTEINPPEKKLAKCTSVHWLQSVMTKVIRILFFTLTIDILKSKASKCNFLVTQAENFTTRSAITQSLGLTYSFGLKVVQCTDLLH